MSEATHPEAFRLATFLVTAARDVIDEPAIYAPFRMVDAVDRLIARSFDDDSSRRSSRNWNGTSRR